MTRQVPNFFTSLNILFGCFGIYVTLSDGSPNALYFVLAAAICDVLDGLLARVLNAKSAFGSQLDSLADLISFGVLPSFYIIILLREQILFYWIGLLIALFSAYRLAQFNIGDTQSDSFLGLPTPANAIMITSLSLVSEALNSTILVGVTMLSCMLLIAPIRLLALKFSQFTWEGNQSKWLLMIGGLILVIVLKWSVLPFLIPYYVLFSLGANMVKNESL